MRIVTKGRALLLAGSLLLTASAAALPGSAEAQVSICRTDPVVTLSNGDVVTLASSIRDSARDVRRVVYSLHGPVGTSALHVGFANSSANIRESISYHADLEWYGYVATTRVITGKSSIVSDRIQWNGGFVSVVQGRTGQVLTLRTAWTGSRSTLPMAGKTDN